MSAENERDGRQDIGPVGMSVPGGSVTVGPGSLRPLSRHGSPDPALDRFTATVVGCLMCGRCELVPTLIVCSRCRQDFSPTPVGTIASILRMTVADLSEISKVPPRTIRRAISGVPLGPKNSAKLAKALGVDRDELRRGTPVKDSLRRKDGTR